MGRKKEMRSLEGDGAGAVSGKAVSVALENNAQIKGDEGDESAVEKHVAG